MDKVLIYGLYNPEYPNEIRYIGKTMDKLNSRLSNHLSNARTCVDKTHRGKWIRSLLESNIKPCIIEIEKCNDKTWKEREVYWISYYRKLYKLTNHSAGGDDCVAKPLVKVIAYNLDGSFYKIFDSIAIACRELSYDRSTIGSALQRARQQNKSGIGGDFLWLYYTKDYRDRIAPYDYPHNQKISCLDLLTNKQLEFESIKDFTIHFKLKRVGTIGRSIDRERPLYKRFKLKRIN